MAVLKCGTVESAVNEGMTSVEFSLDQEICVDTPISSFRSTEQASDTATPSSVPS